MYILNVCVFIAKQNVFFLYSEFYCIQWHQPTCWIVVSFCVCQTLRPLLCSVQPLFVIIILAIIGTQCVNIRYYYILFTEVEVGGHNNKLTRFQLLLYRLLMFCP